MKELPATRGALLALLAALLFGLATPFIKRLGVAEGPWTTAALLYAGAALAGLLTRAGNQAEAALRQGDWPRILLMALFGAVIGPVALAWGLQKTSAMSGSLALTLESVFSVLLAALWYREALGRRVILALATLTLGAALLVFDRAAAGPLEAAGLLAVIGATLAWGVDNTLSRPLAERDPGTVVLAKAACGAAVSCGFAFAFGEHTPAAGTAVGLALVGALGYGVSLRLYLLAQRSFGAARTASVFAAAPFIGAAAAIVFGERDPTLLLLAAACLMLIGVYLHLTEEHVHQHVHAALEHEHAHRHDDGHHTHTHAVMPKGPHSHPHRHVPLTHAHAHVPDAHHLHEHEHPH